ncbi:hypothetical protein ACJ5NV_00575 [Loktanella agnita]
MFLKAAGTDATGWGYAVRHVQSDDDMRAARTHFETKNVDRILVEEAVDVSVCWCANLGVTDDGVTYLGAAEQLFAAPARQAGSMIDPAVAFPAAGIALATKITETARQQGFRGICGLDIGISPDGRLTVFDPNFRFNSSTPQVMLHPAAAARSGLPVSLSFGGQSTRAMAEIISCIKDPIADGWFVPTRLLDAALLPAAEGQSRVTGFVLGASRDAAHARATALAELLA